MSRLFGWDLPPGCSIGDIERAAGGDAIESCCGCGADLTEDNDPEFTGACSAECVWPAIAKAAVAAAAERAADAADAARYEEEERNRESCPRRFEGFSACAAHSLGAPGPCDDMLPIDDGGDQ